MRKVFVLSFSFYVVFCSYLASKFPFSHTPNFQPEWHQSGFFVLPGLILGLPAHLLIMLIANLFGGLLTHPDLSVSGVASDVMGVVSKLIYVGWGVVLYIVIFRFFRWKDRRHEGKASNAKSEAQARNL